MVWHAAPWLSVIPWCQRWWSYLFVYYYSGLMVSCAHGLCCGWWMRLYRCKIVCCPNAYFNYHCARCRRLYYWIQKKKSHSSCGGFAPYIEESLSNMHCGHATLFSPFRSSFLRKVALYFLAKDEDLYASQVLPLGHNQYATLMKSGKGANRTLQKKIAKGMKRRKG